jgi:hypothetical protein
VRLRVAIWNMQQRRDAWEYLDGLDVDVALVQEAVSPADPRPNGWQSVPRWHEPDSWRIDSRRRWSSAIVSYGLPLTEVPTARLGDPLPTGGYWVSHPGALRLAEIEMPERHVLVASLYGVMVDKYAITSMNRHLSDLTPAVFSGRWPRIIVGGDLNISPQLAPPWRRHHELVIERILALGFEDCLGRFHDDYVQTFFRKNAKPYQDDWIFAKGLHQDLRACAPLNNPDERVLSERYSEHCPVIASFEW